MFSPMSANDHPVVGVIGGMGPDATVDLMRRVICATPAKDDADHIHLLVDNNPKVPSRIAALVDGQGESPAPVLVQMAQNLERAGADLLAIPCNTAHAYLEHIRSAVAIPVLDMIQMTADRLTELSSQPEAVGIIASSAVLKTKLYGKALEAHGLDVVLPTVADQDAVMALIKKVKSGQVSIADHQRFSAIANCLVESGAQAIAVACTDLSVMGQDGLISDVPLIDALDVLTEAIVTCVEQLVQSPVRDAIQSVQ